LHYIVYYIVDFDLLTGNGFHTHPHHITKGDRPGYVPFFPLCL